MEGSFHKRLLLLVVAMAGLLVLAGTAAGQCSMCRTALAGSNNALFVRNFNLGVLILLIPPVTIFCSIFVALKRYKTPGDESVKPEHSDDEGDIRA